MEELKPPFEAKYVREYGVHEFYAVDGTPVMAISEPDWRNFFASFAQLPPTGGYIVTPELITWPDKLHDTPKFKQQILDDIECAKQLSVRQPHVYLFLGTATFDTPTPRNSLLILQNGEEMGRVNQRFIPFGTGERKVFEADAADARGRLPKLGHAAIVCADLLFPAFFGSDSREFIDPSAKTLIVTSKWGVPRELTSKQAPFEDDSFKNPLESSIESWFTRYPNLQEIIMVDRADPETGLKPFNAHFQRII